MVLLTRPYIYLLRVCFLLGVFFTMHGAVWAQTTIEPVLLTDSIDRLESAEIRKHQLFLSGEFSLEAVTSDTTLPWQPARGRYETKEDFYGWNKISFQNIGQKIRHDFLIFYSGVSEAKAYILKDGKLIDSLTEENMDALPGLGNSFPISLRPGEKQTLYYYGLYQAGVYSNPPSITSLSAGARVIKSRVVLHYQNYLYAGIMISLVVMSLLLFGLFKERMFIFFALMSFGFIVYFQVIRLLSGMLSFTWLRFGWVWPVDIGLIFIILGSTGFIFDYLNLTQRRSWRSTVFMAFTILAVVACLFTRSDFSDWRTMVLISNSAIVLWMIIAIYVMVYYALRAVPEAKVLLGSVTAMVLFGMAYLLSNNVYGQNSSFASLLQIGTVIFSGIIFVGLYNKVGFIRAKTIQLSNQNNFITRFFTNISHEFRTPLTLMLGPVEQLMERQNTAADQELLEIVQRNAQRQLRLVNQILELSRLEATQLLLHARNVDVLPVLRRIVYGYESLAEQRQIDLSFRTELESLVLRVETDKLETICYNLLTNAFKFTPDGGAITVNLSLDNGAAVVTIHDNGSGIKASALPHIFNRFYSDDEHQYTALEGSGVGLALTRELVRLHGGEITAKSVPGKKTTFRITLPYEPGLVVDVLQETSVNENTPLAIVAQKTTDLLHATPTSNKTVTVAPLIVVVEDNSDLQHYLATSLSPHYRVQLAANGREGLALIEQVMPDLVISDVMMPEMDGFEMCGLLKSRLTISHIPVILLTARSTSEDKVAGLSTGADDYLTKPFNQKELLARARNLIESRKLLRERFAASITLKPEEVTSTSVDREFLLAAMNAVEQNIDKEDFKVAELARELAMSRTSLNQKFRALLDQSTNEFIQNVRLERAADLLLKQQGLPVGDVAFQTGFKSTSYFVRCFREKFGETPGNYRKSASG